MGWRVPNALTPPAGAAQDWRPSDATVVRVIQADGAKLEDAVWTVVKAGSVLGVFASEYVVSTYISAYI